MPHGEDPDGKAPASDDEAPVPQRADGSALVVAVTPYTGKGKNGRPYTKWTVVFDDGREGGTFDEPLAKTAERARIAKELLVPVLEQDGRYTNLLSLTPVEAPGPVADALDAFAAEVEGEPAPPDPESAPDPKLERDLLNSNITALANKLKLRPADRSAAWHTYVGAEYTPATAPPEKLHDLLGWLKTRAGQ